MGKLKSRLVCLHDDKARTLSVLLRNLLRLDSLRELQHEKKPQKSVQQGMEVGVCFANSRRERSWSYRHFKKVARAMQLGGKSPDLCAEGQVRDRDIIQEDVELCRALRQALPHLRVHINMV